MSDIKTNNVWLMKGDCLERMKEIESGSVDLILTDPPYGTTACKWDSVIPLDKMWEQLKRIIKPNGAIVLFGGQPFTSVLISSNITSYRHSWVWDKNLAANFASANKQPLKVTEDILVFSQSNKRSCVYTPQKIKGKMRAKGGGKQFVGIYGDNEKDKVTETYQSDEYHPTNILRFQNASRVGKLHPTQKPVALMEYLVKTYTQEGETVLDFTFGSGTTGVACVNTNRKFIGIEMDDHYFDIGSKRITSAGEV
jgi:site-specific DNA-methyltransferase (adenine-specific)